MESLTCKHCGERHDGNYCWNCGQKRIDRHGFYELKDYLGDALELKRGFLKTIVGLITNPSKVIRDYIGGNTKPYQNPISLFLTIAAISILIDTFLSKEGSNSNLRYSLMITLTVVNTLMIKWFFAQSKINFYESMIFSLYMMVVFAIFMMIIELIKYLIPGELNPTTENVVLITLVPLISIRFCVPFFKNTRFVWLKSILLAPLCIVISMVLIVLLSLFLDKLGYNPLLGT